MVINGQAVINGSGGLSVINAIRQGGVLPPDAPTLLTAVQNGASTIDLAWTDNSGNEDGFSIERSDGADDLWVEIDTVGADAVAYADTPLTSNIYYYRVRAYNAGGYSDYSNEAGAFLYTLLATFTNPEGPPVGSPYNADVGQLTLVQNDSRTFTIASGYMATSGSSSSGWSNRTARSDAITRAYGICMMFSFYRGNINENVLFGWSISTTAPDSNSIALAFLSNGGASWSAQAFYTAVPDVTTNNTWYTFAFVLRSTGAFIYIKGGVYAEWQQVWVEPNNNTATLYSIFSQFSTINTARMDDWKIGRLPAPFTTDSAIATQLVTTAVSGTAYAGVADGTFDLTLTAPNPLSTTCALRFRVQDDSNYWVVYADTDGSIKLDSVVAGVPTNRINVAGVFAAAALRIVRVRTHGSKINVYTRTSATGLWTKRGTEINVSYLDGLTDVKPVAGVGWTLGALQIWNRTPSATALTALLALESGEPGATYDGSGGWFVAP